MIEQINYHSRISMDSLNKNQSQYILVIIHEQRELKFQSIWRFRLIILAI